MTDGPANNMQKKKNFMTAHTHTHTQAKRAEFLSLLQQLLAAKEEAATQRVWLCMEREREEEARGGELLDARLRAVQHQRRIKELLLRTDPELAPGDLRGAGFWGCVCGGRGDRGAHVCVCLD